MWLTQNTINTTKTTTQSRVFGTTTWNLASNSRSCRASLQVWRHGIVQRFRAGINLIFFPLYSPAWQQTPPAPRHNEQLPLYAAIRAAKESKISHAIGAHNGFVCRRFGAKRGIWQTFLLGLQLLSCRVSCRRFDRFHFTLSHWQRCYKQVQKPTKYMKVKKKNTANEQR